MDNLFGGDGPDEITSANVPASRDWVQCGEGVDTAVVDELDDVATTCENVSRLSTEAQAQTEDAQVYAAAYDISEEEEPPVGWRSKTT